MKTTDFDSIIFDMDGTLWDAVDSYCKVWDVTFASFGLDTRISRSDLMKCMGQPIDVIFRNIVTVKVDPEAFLKRLDDNERILMPEYGGVLYPDVKRLIPELAAHYRLFMVSNCGAEGLHNFLRYTGLTPYFTDTLTHGQTSLPKEGNIRRLIVQYDLKSPVYVGDTEGDCRSAHAVPIPMLHVTYGFGSAPDADWHVGSFSELTRFFVS